MGVPAEHVAVEADGGFVVPGMQLEPARGTGLAEDAEALEEAGLPDTDRRAAGVGDNGHGAEVTDIHGWDESLAAVRGGGVDGLPGVVGGQVDRPHVSRARAGRRSPCIRPPGRRPW